MLQLRSLIFIFGLPVGVFSLSSSAATTWSCLCSCNVCSNLWEEYAPSLIVLQFLTVQNMFLHLPSNSAGGIWHIKLTKQGERISIMFFFPIFLPKDFQRVCIFHSLEKVMWSNWVCIASYKSQTEVSQISQSRARLKPDQNFSTGPFMRQLYVEESLSVRVDWLAFTCHSFSSENCTWDSTPFMHSWKYYFESRTLLKLPTGALEKKRD